MEQTTNFNYPISVTIELSYDEINKVINFDGLNDMQGLDICKGLAGSLEHQLQWATDLFLQKVRNGEVELFGELGIYYMYNGKIVVDESCIKKC